MDDWIEFEGRVVPMDWGDSIFTVLPIPDAIARDLKAQGATRVDVELNDCPFNMALTKAPAIESIFLYTGKKVLAEAEIEPGAEINVRLRMADPNLVEVPDDVMAGIMAGGVIDAWNATTPGKKRGMLHGINGAKRAQTRQARIQKLVATLTG